MIGDGLMAFKVVVRQWQAPLLVEAGATILEAALAEGRPYPHGCRAGNCGSCKSHLFAGEVQMAPYSEFALTPEEAKAGLILACRSVPWSDCELAYLEEDEVAAHPHRVLACRVAQLDRLTHDTMRVRLRIEAGGPFDFSAGQYAEVTFPGQPVRDYSMANRPGEDMLEFHIRAVEQGAVSHFVEAGLALGNAVRLEGPYGFCYYRARHRGPIVALAGGSGLAPIKSILEEALASGARQPIHLYLGVCEERDIYLEAHFESLEVRHPNLGFTPVLSEPAAETGRRTGYLGDALLKDFDDLDGAKAYLAGPPVMVESCVEVLKKLGVRAEDCHADPFYTEAEKAPLIGEK